MSAGLPTAALAAAPHPATVTGPFGRANLIETLDSRTIEAMYAEKCGAQVTFAHREIALYGCQQTGMRFWRPETLAGDEAFYQLLSEKWPFYYRPWRWEYGPALALVTPTDRVLEIGCGQGYFLRGTEGRAADAVGLETNRGAIANKVTTRDIYPTTIEDADIGQFDLVCSFQVLEHVVDPASFIRSAIERLRAGGRFAVSTPNPQYRAHRLRQDAFDLPPHHMNQISADSHRRIAEQLGLKVEKILKSPRWGEFALPGQPQTFLSRAEGAARNLVDKVRGEPGSTLFAILRKP